MVKDISLPEKVILSFVALSSLATIAMRFIDEELFMSIVTEDGPLEWMTVVALAATSAVCIYRVFTLRGRRPLLFLVMTMLLGLVFFFGAGEEISWGQRIFNTESSEFFRQHNAQGETNLHNLVVGGKKINKIIFGIGLHLILLVYLLALVPLYKRKPSLKGFLDRFAVPIAKPYQVICYLIVLFLIPLVTQHGKKGELVEFAGSFMFFLNIVFPYNHDRFSSDQQDI